MARGFVVAFCVAALALSVQAAKFTKCDSPSGDFTNVQVSGCSDADKDCILTRNTVANITIDFQTNVKSTALTTVVHGIIAGMDMPFPLSNPDACDIVKCPIDQGTTYEYQASLPILKAYPKIAVMVKWELKDENGNNVVCVKIPARIK